MFISLLVEYLNILLKDNRKSINNLFAFRVVEDTQTNTLLPMAKKVDGNYYFGICAIINGFLDYTKSDKFLGVEWNTKDNIQIDISRFVVVDKNAYRNIKKKAINQ